MLRVVGGDGEADLGVGLEAPIGAEQQEARRLEGVLRRQEDAAMEDAALQCLSACQEACS